VTDKNINMNAGSKATKDRMAAANEAKAGGSGAAGNF
jgi:hypothetical protein